MSGEDFVDRIEGAQAGAVFHRCALQVNSRHCQKVEGDASAHAAAVLAKAGEMGVSALAITDHNDVSGVRAFQDAAKGFGITIFPGFEIAPSEGIHVLCVYSPDTSQSQLERFLGDLGIRETGPSSRLSEHSSRHVPTWNLKEPNNWIACGTYLKLPK